MEEEDLCSSLPEATNSVVFAPSLNSQTSTDHQYLKSEPDAAAKDHKELLKKQKEEPQNYVHKEHNGTSEENETWEQILWPACNSALDWDMPKAPFGTPSLLTESVGTDQCDSSTRTDSTSFPVHSQRDNKDLFSEAEEQDEFDSWLLLCSESDWMRPNSKPCDTESTEAERTQEEEQATHKLLNHQSGTPLRSCLQSQKHIQCAEEDFIHSCVEIQFAEFIEDDIEHLRLEDKSDETDILLTGQTDFEEVGTLVNGDEITGDPEEEQLVTNEEATAASCHSAAEVPGEELQNDETGFILNPEKLIELQQLLEDLSNIEKTNTRTHRQQYLSEDPSKVVEMCKDLKKDVPREYLEEEPRTVSEETAQAADNTNSSESSHKDKVRLSCNQPLPAESKENQLQQIVPQGIDVSGVLQTTTSPQVHKGRYEENEDTMDNNDKQSREKTETNGEQCNVAPHMNGGKVDREKVCRLAERLFKLDGVQRIDVVKHLDKDNSFSRAVGEEYLKYFDFSGQTLDQALRSFLSVVVLIGESQERERVLQHFSSRYEQCNPEFFCSSGSVLALTCAMMLLNTDLHGQHVGKSMSCSKFVTNLDGMNEGENFNKDLLKSLYSSIKAEPLQWALDEEELSSVLEEETGEVAPLRSTANPFLDVPYDKNAVVIKEGFLQRKIHADVDGKRTPWGKRRWKIFNAVLRGMVLYLQKDDSRKEVQIGEEVLSVHHSLAEEATDYTKRPHVFRLQTADWRVFLFQASSNTEMIQWIHRINLVSALHSSPPFPAAVGSQRRFCRPILPASQSANTLERQLQSHTRMLESFRADLSHLHEPPAEGRRAKAKELEELRQREEYLQHEVCRYEAYIRALEVWKSVKTTDDVSISGADLVQFDRELFGGDAAAEGEDEEQGLKKSHSSPSLELEVPSPAPVKVRRNISERRTYRKAFAPR